jgi:CheY-like chemotaxis protein
VPASEVPTDNVCLLLEVYMPGMSGIELCRNVAAMGRHLPTVLMSARDDQQTRQIVRQVKSIAGIFPPFDEKHYPTSYPEGIAQSAEFTAVDGGSRSDGQATFRKSLF